MRSPTRLTGLAAAVFLGACCLPAGAGAADRSPTTIQRGVAPARTPTTRAPMVPAKKLVRPCRPEIQTIGPLGCYEPGTSLVTLFGSCLGSEPGPYRLVLEVGGTSTAVRHKTWDDDAVSFTLPRSRALPPGAKGFAGVVDASKKAVARKQPFAVCPEPVRTEKPPLAPTAGVRAAEIKPLAPSPVIVGGTLPGSTAAKMSTPPPPPPPPASPGGSGGGGPSGGSDQAQYGSAAMQAVRLKSGVVQAQQPGAPMATPPMAGAPTAAQSLKGTKFSGDGGGVQWDSSGLGGARATYTAGVGFVEAAGGIALVGAEIDVVSVDASVYCPPGRSVKSVQIHSLGGGSNSLAWPYAEENRTVAVHFERVGLLSAQSAASLGLCPREPALVTVNRSVDLFFVFLCQNPDGGVTIPEQQVAFSVPVELTCYQESRFRSTARSVKFRHECPPGYVVKSTGQPFWEGSAGWADPQVCVKTP